jgi:hypothetical protein
VFNFLMGGALALGALLLITTVELGERDDGV